MSPGFCITVRNENDEVIEYRTGNCVLHIDVPEGRYVITITSDAVECGAEDSPIVGRLQ
jgi:hypothetical protein